MRWRCWLFGCYLGSEYGQHDQCCQSCESDYCGGWIECGLIERMFGHFWRYKSWLPRRCEICGKIMWIHGRYDVTCSSKCFDQWIMF